MRTKIVGILILIILTTFCNHAQTADAPIQYPGPYPVELKVGEVIIISKSFDIVTPVITPICDDLKVVDVVDTPDGPAFKGIAPGDAPGRNPLRPFPSKQEQEAFSSTFR